MTFEIPDTKTLEPGTYKAQLEKVELKSGGKFGDGNYRLWSWLVDVNGTLEPFSDTTSVNTGPRSTSYARLTALLGKAPQAGEKIETPTGKTVLLQVETKENGFPKVVAVLPFVNPQQELAGVPR